MAPSLITGGFFYFLLKLAASPPSIMIENVWTEIRGHWAVVRCRLFFGPDPPPVVQILRRKNKTGTSSRENLTPDLGPRTVYFLPGPFRYRVKNR